MNRATQAGPRFTGHPPSQAVVQLDTACKALKEAATEDTEAPG